MALSKIFTDQPPDDLSKEDSVLLEQVRAVRTTPRDARFPSQNQANHCWNRYNEWLLCVKQTSDVAGCAKLRQYALSICQPIWYEKWDEEREEKTFAGLQVDVPASTSTTADDDDE